MATTARLLDRLEAYYDAVPRSAARCEQIGPFTLFVKLGGGWPYYARPSLGSSVFSADEVRRVRARQRELTIPEAFEWVAETSPALEQAAQAGGLAATRHPLMVLREPRGSSSTALAGVELRLAAEEDDLALLNAVGRVAFGAPGTAVGSAGVEAALALLERDPTRIASQRARLREGKTIMAVALVDGQPVGIASHQPVERVAEVVGVAVLPAFRRRGIASLLTARLIDDAQERDVQMVFLSADDEAVARIYARLGFRTVGTACIAEPATWPRAWT